jgi:predicted negative regulator of RcsB-dependent stress response
MNNTAAIFQKLCDQRDLAAYRVVAAVRSVLDFFEAQDFASAEDSLRRARAEYDEADARLNEFRNSLQGEKHGHSTAA